MLEDILVSGGHEVIGPASTLSEALTLARQSIPQLALLDIRLSDGSKGTDLARILLREFGTPSIFVSGNMRQAHEAADVALGCIGKPYEADIVLKSVEVAQTILQGLYPRREQIPSGLELFRYGAQH
jgi:CheY-like chemotaxis protein